MKSILYNTNDQHSFNKIVDILNGMDEHHKGKIVTYRIDMKKNRPVRSLDQNAHYWVILTRIGAHTGYTKERLHEWYGLEFIPTEFNGKIVPRSTTELDSEEMSTYIKKVMTHAEEIHGLTFPRPGDRDYANWERMSQNFYDDMFRSI